MAIKKATEGAVYILDVLSTLTTAATTEDAATAIYQITVTSQRVLEPNSSVTAVGGTVDKTWGDEGWDYFRGRVKCTASGLSALVVNVTYASIQEVGYVYNVSLNLSRNVGEITAIGDTWRSLIGMNVQASITFERYRFDTLMQNPRDVTSAFALGYSQWILFKTMEDASGGYWAKCLLTQHAMNKAVGNVDNDPITLEVSSWMQRVV